MNSLEQLDLSLRFLCKKNDKGELEEGGFITFDKFEENLRSNGIGDENLFIPIAEQLELDGYVKFWPENRKSNEKISDIKATFKGIFFIENEGYAYQKTKQIEEKKKIDRIERMQIMQGNWMIFLTCLLSIGTGIAAVYYFLEMIK